MALTLMMAGTAMAAYPTKPVVLITHSSPGAGGDIFLRNLTKHMEPYLGGASLVVENKAGGGVAAMHGSMCKFYHAGKGAELGLRSALMAELGFNSAAEPIIDPKGYLNVAAGDRAVSRLTDGLGSRYRKSLLQRRTSFDFYPAFQYKFNS